MLIAETPARPKQCGDNLLGGVGALGRSEKFQPSLLLGSAPAEIISETGTDPFAVAKSKQKPQVSMHSMGSAADSKSNHMAPK